ncbi:cullin-2-like [Styela clava]
MSLKPRSVDFNSTWLKLSATMNNVVTSNPVQRSTWNEMFMDVYALCIARPEPLTNELYSGIKEFLEHHVSQLYEKMNASENLLGQYYKYWVEYSRGAQYLDQLFRYLNQQHVKKYKQTAADLDYEFSFDVKDPMLEVGELALDIWHTVMIEKVSDKLVELLLNLIDEDRAKHTVDKAVINGVIQSFVLVKHYRRKQPLKLYEECFEEKYLARSVEYYKMKASEFIESEDCSLYMEKVLQLLTEEEMRSSNFLNSSSYPKVRKECRQCMVSDHMQFLHSNCKDMIKQDRQTDLQHVYTLLKNVPDGLVQVCNELQQHIEETGLSMVKNLKDDSSIAASFVDCIIQVHNRFSQTITECFQDDKQFTRALQKACGTIVNYKEKRQPCRSPELVSKYSDSLLRKGVKGLTDSDIDERLKNCITVFRYIEDKDLFQKFYSRNLAKRLIHGLCSSMYTEESMINRLKSVCGYDFTSKLHRMYNDMRLSADLNTKFSDFLTKHNEDVNINFNVNVLQAGAWPLNSTQTPFHLPQELTKSVLQFEKFYGDNFNGRKLSWLHHLSQAEVRVQITSKTYFVTMSTYQLSILLLFNQSPDLLFSFIVKSTGLGDRELEKTINLLSDARILIKEKVDDDDTKFSINFNFTNKRTRFKIAAATQKDTMQEVQTTHSAIAEDRKLYLQAAIVRIMKARKTLRHNELMQEVISLSRARFSPSVSVIKKSIESLIEKSYLERSPNCPDEYMYLA